MNTELDKKINEAYDVTDDRNNGLMREAALDVEVNRIAERIKIRSYVGQMDSVQLFEFEHWDHNPALFRLSHFCAEGVR